MGGRVAQERSGRRTEEGSQREPEDGARGRQFTTASIVGQVARALCLVIALENSLTSSPLVSSVETTLPFGFSSGPDDARVVSTVMNQEQCGS